MLPSKQNFIADKIIINGKLVNVLTREVYQAQVAIKDGRIYAVGEDLASLKGRKTVTIDAKKRFIAPGFIDYHLHLHHTLLNIVEFSKIAVKRGTTAFATDLYGEGVVGGVPAIRETLNIVRKLPIRLFFLLPFCAYIQNRPFAHNGNIRIEDMYEMLSWKECIGMCDTFASEVIYNKEVFELCKKTQSLYKVVSGHEFNLSNMERNRWVWELKEADNHECISEKEMLDELRLGISVSMRLASGSENLPELCNLFKRHRNIEKRRVTLNTDVISPADLYEKGGIDRAVRLVIESGVPPLEAYQLATINAAENLKVSSYYGSIAPGRIADILFLDRLEDVSISSVMYNGEIILDDDEFLIDFPKIDYPEEFTNTVKIASSFTKDKLKFFYSDKEKVKVRVIKVFPNSYTTTEIIEDLIVEDGIVKCDVERDILYISAIERVLGNGKVSNAFVNGVSLKSGAIGLTYNSHCQNLIIVGTNHDDMYLALEELRKIGGGCIAVNNGKVAAALELGLFGLESLKDLAIVVKESEALHNAVKEMGCNLPSPFETLSFAALPIALGGLKICPEGLVDVGPVDLYQAKTVNVVLE